MKCTSAIFQALSTQLESLQKLKHDTTWCVRFVCYLDMATAGFVWKGSTCLIKYIIYLFPLPDFSADNSNHQTDELDGIQ
jgi:hypothetical protein